MGCVSSKKARSQSPAFDDVYSYTSSGRGGRSSGSGRLASSGLLNVDAALGPLEKIKEESDREVEVEVELELEEEDRESGKKRYDYDRYSGNLRELNREASQKNASFGIRVGRLMEAEQVAAGWPPWLSAVAADAIEGWLPLRADTFERLDKIGQGTYSNVYRARYLKTGKIVAVKKVRFDNFQPESVRFMAREILILRKLDHPNVMKLEGIITSRLSCTIYLVFEYMEHDLAGLLSCPDVKFTDSQIKCFMRQLLSGLEHCHSRGIMHRDIKCSNILVNNEGVLKIADFGLANFMRPKNKEPLTSRVVTLWYRAPELLLGSTNYGEAVDLWSVGCVFAELFIGRPILKGRNEVEQLHKIFKLCGTPSDDYWKTSKLPLATMFKPQQPYESTLRERCKEFPKSAVGLVETLLSVEPCKRGTAVSALISEYFTTKPYACDPSSLPKYPPNKEIDARAREEARRKNVSAQPAAASRNPRKVRKTLQESSDFCKVIPMEEIDAKVQLARKNNGGSGNANRRRSGVGSRTSLKQSYDTKSEVSQASTQESVSSVRSVPVQMTASSGFAWAKKQKQQDVFTRLYNQPASRSQKSYALEPSTILHSYIMKSDSQENGGSSGRVNGVEAAKRAMRRAQLQRHESFDYSDIYVPHDLSEDYGKKIKFSGPLTDQSQEMASMQCDQPRQALRSSRFRID